MRGWMLALARSAWALQGVTAGCWADPWDWNPPICTGGLQPRAR